MCGIAGILVDTDGAAELQQSVRSHVERMCEVQKARGPDARGLHELGRATLGHTRLSIIDVADRANQPMLSKCGNYVLVFNGEIYNYKELMKDLRLSGVEFVTTSDTEVLLEFLIYYRGRYLERLNGIFAFGFYDLRANQLVLARDRFGVKPLYIYRADYGVAFASTVAALSEIVESASPDCYARDYFLLMGNLPASHTHLTDIIAVEAGTSLLISEGNVQKENFFSMADEVLEGAVRSMISESSSDQKELEEVLGSAFVQQSVSDVKSVVWLSSGVDSSLILYLMSREGVEIDSLTIGFEEYQRTNNDEVPNAVELCKRLGTPHQSCFLASLNVEQFFTDMDQPTIDAANTWLISKATNELGIKVAFTGVGADELFFGYPSFSRIPNMRRLSLFADSVIPKSLRLSFYRNLARVVGNKKIIFLPYFNQNLITMFLLYRAATRSPDLLADINNPNRSFDTLVDYLNFDSHAKELISHANPLALLTFLEISIYMQSQLLRDIDWASMSHSVEARVPFLDNDVVDLVLNKRRAGRFYSKNNLLHCLSPTERSLLMKKKTGFTTPVRQWMYDAGYIKDTSMDSLIQTVSQKFW